MLRQIELRKQKHADAGKPPPKLSPKERAVLRAQPELDMQASIVLSAWQTLDSCRALGVRPMPVPKGQPIMVPYAGPIPWTAIERYGRLHGLGREAVVLLAEVIARLDFERSEREASELRTRSKR